MEIETLYQCSENDEYLLYAPKIKRREQMMPKRESKTAYWGEEEMEGTGSVQLMYLDDSFFFINKP